MSEPYITKTTAATQDYLMESCCRTDSVGNVSEASALPAFRSRLDPPQFAQSHGSADECAL